MYENLYQYKNKWENITELYAKQFVTYVMRIQI